MRELWPAQTAWIDRARDADILAVAQRAPISAKLKKHAREYVGACPVCGGKDRFAVNPTKKGGVFFCRGFGGGDVIAMVQHVCGVTFLPACEIINGMLRKINFWAETLRRSRGRLPAAARDILTRPRLRP